MISFSVFHPQEFRETTSDEAKLARQAICSQVRSPPWSEPVCGQLGQSIIAHFFKRPSYCGERLRFCSRNSNEVAICMWVLGPSSCLPVLLELPWILLSGMLFMRMIAKSYVSSPEELLQEYSSSGWVALCFWALDPFSSLFVLPELPWMFASGYVSSPEKLSTNCYKHTPALVEWSSVLGYLQLFACVTKANLDFTEKDTVYEDDASSYVSSPEDPATVESTTSIATRVLSSGWVALCSWALDPFSCSPATRATLDVTEREGNKEKKHHLSKAV